MPGILTRTAFYEKLSTGQLRQMDFYLVNTDLGAMIEPAQVPGLGTEGVRTVSTDPLDGVIDDIYVGRRAEILRDMLVTGLQTPRLY